MRVAALSLFAAILAATALASASGAGTAKLPKLARIDVSSRTAITHYLRSIHVSTKGVVIQRGLRNYAGANCPGQGWLCTRTTHPVVQVAQAGGRNTFRCSTGRCAVVQVAASALATNTAKCIKVGGLAPQSCSINQSSASANNVAIVYQLAVGLIARTQTASVAASITQTATGASNTNTACVSQNVLMDGSTVATQPVTVALEAHQTVTIKQDSSHGGNSARSSATALGTCDTGHPLAQNQLLNSVAVGHGAITQNENAANNGPNLTIDIEQNQSPLFLGLAHGPNSANFNQANSLTAVATTPSGPVSQTQSSVNGGLLGTINQDSRDLSTATATQTEIQCEDAHGSASLKCDHASSDPPGYSLTQTQFGPVHKGVGTATQTGNTGDTFSVNQSSTQDNDQGSGSQQTNVVQGDCSTSGTSPTACTVTQNTNVDGHQSTNTQSGQDVNTTTTCTGSACTVLPPPTIDTSPASTSNSPEATFTFSDSNNALSMLCSLDGGPYSICLFNQRTYTGLADGSHTFSVEATDGNGHFSDPVSYTWTVSVFNWNSGMTQLAATNVDVGEFGYGGMRGNGTGTIGVAGVSGTVLRAYLYWHGPTNSTATSETVSFGGQSVSGTNIGTSYDNNWGFSNSQSYRADVTSLVTGNGGYALNSFLQSGIDVNGVALVVFYDDGDTSNDRNTVLWNGNDSDCAAGPSQDSWDETLTGVPYPGSGAASLDLIVGDGQNGSGFDDPQLLVNGSELVPAGPTFDGSTPGGSGGDGNGSLWDVEPFVLTPFLSAGPNSVHLTTGTFPGAYDCLSLVVAVANSPASAVVIP